jgi:hypothetical protein
LGKPAKNNRNYKTYEDDKLFKINSNYIINILNYYVMRKVFSILVCMALVSIVAISCKKEGQCYCYTDVQNLRWVDPSATTKKQCKELSKKRQDSSMSSDICKWE